SSDLARRQVPDAAPSPCFTGNFSRGNCCCQPHTALHADMRKAHDALRKTGAASGIVGGSRHTLPEARMSPKKTSFPKSDIRVLLLEGVSQTAVDTFRAAGYEHIEFHDKSLPEDELKARIAEAHIVGIRSRTQLTADVLSNAKRLIAIGCFCIGTNQVDLEAAELAGIPVFNAPYSNTRSVAELVVAQAVMLMRGIPQKNAECHRGGWSKSAA